MKADEERARTVSLHERVATFNRESLPSNEVVLKTTKDIEHRFSEQLRERYKERRAIAESLKKICAPLAEIVGKDKHAVEEQRKLRARLSQGITQKPAPPKITPAKSMIKSGSILTLVAPPYDYQWQWVDPNNTGRADASADRFSGSFGGDAWSDEGPAPSGYGQAAAGFGIGFHPMTEVFLSIQYQLMYNAHWYENSNIDTAHTSGSSEILIYQYDLGWNFQQVFANTSSQIWSDGTGWFETHIGGTNVTESFNPPFFEMFFSPNNNYVLWFIGRWEADGAGDPNGPINSQARCWLQGNLPFVVLEQF